MARDFSGTNQYGNFTGPSFGGSHTLMCWVNADSWDVSADDFGVCGLFAAKGQWGSDAAGDTRLTIITSAAPFSRLHFQVHTSGGDADSVYGLAENGVSTGAWHHFIGQYDESITRTRIYLDGVAHGDVTSSGTYSNRAVGGAVGAYPNNEGGTEFNGRIAELAIWSRALTEDEIIALSKGYSPKHFPRGLIFYCPLWGKISPEPEQIGAANVTITGAIEAVHQPIIQMPGSNSVFSTPPVPPLFSIGSTLVKVSSNINLKEQALITLSPSLAKIRASLQSFPTDPNEVWVETWEEQDP